MKSTHKATSSLHTHLPGTELLMNGQVLVSLTVVDEQTLVNLWEQKHGNK